MSADPYEILGVSRDADRETVRRAYRKRSKSAHPDAGGSPDEFALVKLAADTLSDDTRRARFDQTGRMEQAEVDNRFSQVVHFIAMALNGVLDMCAQKQRRPTEIDMMLSLRQGLGLLLDQCRQNQKKMSGMMAEAQMLDGRFSNRRGKVDVLGNMIRSRITEAEQALRLEVEKEKLIQEAIEVVAQHAFRTDMGSSVSGGGAHTIADYMAVAMGGHGRARMGP